MLIRRLFAFFITAAIAVGALADSDGSYCAADSYLAYELRQADGQHTLVVLRTVADHSIAELHVTLPDFQVHGMRCTDGAVQLAGWDATYTVDLSSETPRVRSEPLARPGDLPKWPNANLAHRNREARHSDSAIVELPWQVPHFLKVVRAPTQDECTRKLTLELYRHGTPQPVKTLFEREIGVECGE
ncbi:MAG TPA: hypothetical protein VEK79_03655 [Thermoanaerobaculia bacterium]|nr:hypothetical protein [Thermoanaerobaculia bacterium]